ncbi:MAG: DsbA family protein [Myxococcaceae bacterium]
MKPNVLVALLVGSVLGFALGRATTPEATAPSLVAQAPKGRAEGGVPAGTDAAQRPADDGRIRRVPIEGSPVRGPESALVTLVEFTDYECPFCSRGDRTVAQLVEEYGSKLRLVLKQFPLNQIHPHAKGAAIAAFAAGEQGKYWQMHSKLFENQKQLNDADLERYAKDIGLDVRRWKAALAKPELAQKVAADQALGESVGVSGTPAFFINGRFLSGARPPEAFRRIIDEELTKAEQLVAQGVAPTQVYARIMQNAAAGTPKPGAVLQKVDVPEDAPFVGPKSAKVTIVEWSDFQCPFCKRGGDTVKDLAQRYPNDVKVVFRHLPLSMHKDAQLAAEATMAAHEQGKFWQMHDKLFANQSALGRADLERYASELGLDMARFRASLDNGRHRARVAQDASAASAAGVTGTPTFFINGRKIVGALPADQFNVPEEVEKANKLLASGVKMDRLYERLVSGRD